MKLWISSETSKGIGRGLNKLYMPIEKTINTYIDDINYSNDHVNKLRLIIVVRNDDYFNEIIKIRKKTKEHGLHLKIDFKTYETANEEEKKKLIYELLLRSFDILKDKGLGDFEPVEDFIKRII